MHTKEACELGESETRLQLLDAWPGSNIFSERELAALAWAQPLMDIAATRSHSVDDEARRRFSDKGLADLSIVIAMINAWNRDDNAK